MSDDNPDKKVVEMEEEGKEDENEGVNGDNSNNNEESGSNDDFQINNESEENDNINNEINEGNEIPDENYEREVAFGRNVNDMSNEEESSSDRGEDLFDQKLMEEDYNESEDSEYNDPKLINNESEEQVVDYYEAVNAANKELDERDAALKQLMRNDKEIEEDERNQQILELIQSQAFRRRNELEQEVNEMDGVVNETNKMTYKEVQDRFKEREVVRISNADLKELIKETEGKLQSIRKNEIKQMIKKEEVCDLIEETLTNFILYYTAADTTSKVELVKDIRRLI